MTADYTKLASYEIINIMWSELQAVNLFSSNNYIPDGFLEPLVPIFPAQQIPEMNNLLPGRAYFTYDIAQKNKGVQWWMSEETIVIDIVSKNTAQIQTVINFLTDLFRRYDESAKTVNFQLTSNSPFQFMFFKLESSDPVQPFTDEGGFMVGTMSITYSYIRVLDPITGRFA
jgi:hypothetical protein